MLKAILNEAPAKELEGFYKKEGEIWLLQVEPVSGFALENVAGLKSALAKERENFETASRKLTAVEGLDVEAAKEAMAELEKLRAIDPAKEADKIADEKFKAAAKKLADKHNSEVAEYKSKIESLTGVVDEVVRKQVSAEALAREKGNSDLLMPIIMPRTRTVEKSGAYVVEVLDEYGNIATDAKGDPLDISGFVAKLKQDDRFKAAFAESGTSGTGKGPNGSPGGARLKRSTMSMSERAEYIRQHGQDAYHSLEK